jgi:hypothetical protein
MWPEIKTRKCFSRLAGGADADGRPATALAQRPGKGVPASIVERVPASFDEGASPFAFGGALWSAVVPRSAGILPDLLIFAFAVGFPRTPACPEQSQRVSRLAPPTHRRAFCTAGILAGSFASFRRNTNLPLSAIPPSGSSVLTNHKSPVTSHGFLIGTPRLEFPTTQTKQSADPISNRDRLAYFRAVFLPWWTRFSRSGRFAGTLITDRSPHLTEFLIANPELEFRLSPSKHTHLKISNREYIAVFQSAFSHPASISTLLSSSIVSLNCPPAESRVTCLPAEANAPSGSLLFTNHKSPVTSHDFLIYGSAIRIPGKPLKT